MAPNGRIEDPVVAQVINQLIDNRSQDVNRIKKLEDKFDQQKERFDDFEKNNIHNNYKLRNLVVDAVTEGLKPLLAANDILSSRVTIVEDLPKTRSQKFVTWLVGALGIIIVGLASALIHMALKI